MKHAMKGLLAAAVLSILTVAAAQADRTESTSFGIGVSSGTVFGEDLIGIGGTIDIPFAAGRRSFNVSGAYDAGHSKDVDSSPPPVTREYDTSGYRLRVGVDHQMAIGDRGVLYVGPGISYASHTTTRKETGFADRELAPYKVWGIPCRIGVSVAATEQVEAFAQVEQTFGWASYEQGTDKVTQTDVMTGFTFGIRFVVSNRQ